MQMIKDLRKIMVPLPGKETQTKALQNLVAKQETVNELKKRAIALQNEAEELEKRMINEVALAVAGFCFL